MDMEQEDIEFLMVAATEQLVGRDTYRTERLAKILEEHMEELSAGSKERLADIIEEYRDAHETDLQCTQFWRMNAVPFLELLKGLRG